jgi:hypothetical protein
MTSDPPPLRAGIPMVNINADRSPSKCPKLASPISAPPRQIPTIAITSKTVEYGFAGSFTFPN